MTLHQTFDFIVHTILTQEDDTFSTIYFTLSSAEVFFTLVKTNKMKDKTKNTVFDLLYNNENVKILLENFDTKHENNYPTSQIFIKLQVKKDFVNTLCMHVLDEFYTLKRPYLQSCKKEFCEKYDSKNSVELENLIFIKDTLLCIQKFLSP